MASRVKTIIIATLLLALFGVGSHFALAQTDPTDALVATGTSAGFGSGNLLSIIGTIIKVFLGLLGIIFLIIMLYAGFLWMTAGGDGKQVDKAKKLLINAVIGIVIILSAFAITSFILNAILDATTGGSTNTNPPVTTTPFSNSLGNGAVRDHYPLRDQTDVARNTNITVTFRDEMDIESFISGYDNGGTPLDVSDDTTATAINSANVKIYASAGGESTALSNVDVYFTDDLKTFMFNPVDYLGSPTGPVSYTVVLEPKIQDANGASVFVGKNKDGYEWSFATGVNLDLDPPTVLSVVPVASGTYAKNIIVQITFDEPMDPTSSSGIRQAQRGFSNIQTTGTDGVPTAGQYFISNGYRTITFQSSTACGTNSCGNTIYCLPGGQAINVNIRAATTSTPPQADSFPYDGVVDMAANSLDGNSNDIAGDGYIWNFETTNDIFLRGSSIESITPDLQAESVSLDQDVDLIFSDILMSSTVSADNISLTNTELVSGQSHEQWFRFDVDDLTSAGTPVTSRSDVPTKSLVTMPHGVLLESVDGKTYMYGVDVSERVLNQYQNCFLPADGPGVSGNACAVTLTAPYCCNGTAQATTCTLF